MKLGDVRLSSLDRQASSSTQPQENQCSSPRSSGPTSRLRPDPETWRSPASRPTAATCGPVRLCGDRRQQSGWRTLHRRCGRQGRHCDSDEQGRGGCRRGRYSGVARRRAAPRAGTDGGALLRTAQPQTVVAVTGTSGKTSVADFTRQIYAALGHNSASLGTIGLVKTRRCHLRLADDARSGLAAQDAGGAGRPRASRTWRSKPPRTGSISIASTACC